MDRPPRYRVPDELRLALLDFTIAYLLEKPNNLSEFGVNFFQRRGAGRGSTTSQAVQNASGNLNGGDTDDIDGKEMK